MFLIVRKTWRKPAGKLEDSTSLQSGVLCNHFVFVDNQQSPRGKLTTSVTS